MNLQTMSIMKYKLLVLLLAALPVFSGLGKNNPVESASSASTVADPIRTLHLGIVGLRESRTELAQSTILAVPGVVAVDLDVSKRQAQITLDIEKTDIRLLQKSLRKAGFTPWFR